MKYFCEKCSSLYDTEKEVLECEKKHQEEKIRKEKLAEQKQNRLDDINSDAEKLANKIERFQKDYGSIRLHGRNGNLFDLFLGW